MDLETKVLAFEYLLTQLLSWGKELIPAVPESSFTRLKALKLLFFTAAVKDDQGHDLLDIFDNFYALPNGPVESDIYNSITSDRLNYYTFKDFSFGLKQQFSNDGIPNEIKSRVNQAVASLKNKNYKLASYNAEQLVMLSHFWVSWQSAIQIAKFLGKGSYRMDVNRIKNNVQIFSL